MEFFVYLGLALFPLQCAEKCDKLETMCSVVEECGGLDKIEALQNHENEQVYKIAFKMVEEYFGEEVSTVQFLHNHCLG